MATDITSSEYRTLTNIKEETFIDSTEVLMRDRIIGINIIPYCCSDSSGFVFYDYITNDIYTPGEALKDYANGSLLSKYFGIIRYINTDDILLVGDIYFTQEDYINEYVYRENYISDNIATYQLENFVLDSTVYFDYNQLPTITTNTIEYDTTSIKIGNDIIVDYDGTNYIKVGNVALSDIFYNTSYVTYDAAHVYDSTILQITKVTYSGSYDQTILFTRHLPNTYDYTSIELFISGSDYLVKLNDIIYVLFRDDKTYITRANINKKYRILQFLNTYYLIEDISTIPETRNSFRLNTNAKYNFAKEIYYKELTDGKTTTYIKDIQYSNVFTFKEFNDESVFQWIHNDDPIFNFLYSPTYSYLMEVEDGTNVVIDKFSKVIIDYSWRNLSEGLILLTSDIGYLCSYTMEENYLNKSLNNLTIIKGKKINDTYYRRII